MHAACFVIIATGNVFRDILQLSNYCLQTPIADVKPCSASLQLH